MEQLKRYFVARNNSDFQFLRALLGRLPRHQAAEARGYELGIQVLDDYTPGLRRALIAEYGADSFDDDYTETSMRRVQDFQSKVYGQVIWINERERKMLDEWMMEGMWHETVRIRTNIGMAYTHLLVRQDIKPSRGSADGKIHSDQEAIDFITGEARTLRSKKHQNRKKKR